MSSHTPDPSQKQLGLFLSLLPLIALIAMLSVVISIFGSDSLSGGSQIVLLTSSALCFLVARIACKTPWKHFEQAITHNITSVSTALILLLLIGALSGSWMISGIVPTLIYYGMQILHPSFFLVSCCLICALVSVMTGSSWTTVATIGIALIGIGRAQGFDDGWIAGAIISGAYFGDKISPLSDTTVLASSVSQVPLFRHIRYMLITTVPSMLIALGVFFVAGLSHPMEHTERIAEVAAGLQQRFHISLWLMLVLVATGLLIAKKVPPLITLFLSTLMATIFALFFQSDLLLEIAGAAESSWQALTQGALTMVYGSTHLQVADAELAELISTRGMSGMMSTVWLILCAMCFGGAMTASGMTDSITRFFRRFARNRTGMVSSTICSGVFMNITSADQYLSIILTSSMFRPIYEREGYENRLLSRTTEDAVTVTSVLIPWNTCGMTQATILGVPTLTYLPYCVFNYASPLISILIAATGYKIFRRKP